ncbi:hypothetical protein JCM11641_000928 [Rhodosporidiobolus odoratus]
MGKRRVYHQGASNEKPNRFFGAMARNVAPWLCAASAALLAGATSWAQAESKDPVVGAVTCGLAGVACVVGFYFLRKGDNYHKKHKGTAPWEVPHQQHPIQFASYFVFATGMAAFLTEGAYLYLLACIVADNDQNYCVTFSPGTSKAKCSGSATAIGIQIVGLLALGGFAWMFEHVVMEACEWFDYKKFQHAQRFANGQGGYQQGNQKGNSKTMYDDGNYTGDETPPPPGYNEKYGRNQYDDQDQGGYNQGGYDQGSNRDRGYDNGYNNGRY